MLGIRRTCIAAIAVLAQLGGARAGPLASSVEPQPTPADVTTLVLPPSQPRPRTAADVHGAPLPGQESGRIDSLDESDSTARVIARGALFVPKLAIQIGMAPMRGLMWIDDQYNLEGLYYRAFFNADRTIGLFPTATYTSGFGFDVGARFEDRDVFGEHESIALQATTGAITGESYRAGARASLHTGDRLAPWLQVGAQADVERRPADPFYGIGNGDLVTSTPAPIDPRRDPTAVATYYRYQEARVAVSGDLHTRRLHLDATGTLTQLHLSSSTEGTPIDEVYVPAALVGFMSGVDNIYGELGMRWDSRRPASVWEPKDGHSDGSLALGFVGRMHGLDGSRDFWHYGVEFQHYLRLGRGPRVLIARFRGDGVTGSVDEVPFLELPTLGGGTFLRGYTFERFRDRVAAVASLQYQWDISRYADAYLFSDAGRVMRSLGAVSVDGLRVGFGIGVRIRIENGFLLEASLASSIDGGVFAAVSFNPVFDSGVRWR